MVPRQPDPLAAAPHVMSSRPWSPLATTAFDSEENISVVMKQQIRKALAIALCECLKEEVKLYVCAKFLSLGFSTPFSLSLEVWATLVIYLPDDD